MPVPSFAECLADALSEARIATTEPSTRRAGLAFLPAHPLLFARVIERPSSACQSVQPAAAACWPAGAAVPPHRARSGRCLTPAEREALDRLIGLGAALSADFTLHDLRRAYRLLARRIHPDRHPGASADERRRLSRAFAAATDSYRLLAPIATAH